ncbi:MAG: hypothetical protein IJ565_01395 [Bacilli bacterium]|nr:hypothetical protein [Bacilli bacterium]
MQNGMIGFDPEVVSKSINAVKEAYSSYNQAMNIDLQSKFVGKMAEGWACNQAIQFFNTYKSGIDGLFSAADRTFRSVIQTMNDGARSWANKTNTTYSDIQPNETTNNCDVSLIRENINGVRGIDPSISSEAISNLNTCVSNASGALSNAVSAVQNCGFIGGDQSANLIASLNKINQDLTNVINDTNSSLKTAIDSTNEQYAQISASTAQSFTAQ